jgi:hypothetical protein
MVSAIQVESHSSFVTYLDSRARGMLPIGSELITTIEPTPDTTQSFVVSGLTRAQPLNGVLQVRVRATRGSSNTAFTASLDAVSVKVDYTAPVITSFTVDANGNTLTRGSDTFSYDQVNRLKSATVSGVTETYSYDGDGVRFTGRSAEPGDPLCQRRQHEPAGDPRRRVPQVCLRARSGLRRQRQHSRDLPHRSTWLGPGHHRRHRLRDRHLPDRRLRPAD